ncbi:MAG: hypothetical protein ACOYIP_01060 [Coriobacteriales bacterium]|jgi:hypothetical protein
MDQRNGNSGRRRQGPPPKRQERSQPYAGSRGQMRSRSGDDEFEYQDMRSKRSGGNGRASRSAASQRARTDRNRPMFDGSSGSLRERYEGEAPRGNNARSQRIVIIIAIIIAVLVIIGIAKCVGSVNSVGEDVAKEGTKAEQAATDGKTGEAADGAATTGGVESPWTESKTFSSGDATFDARLKDYCDQHTQEGADAETAAKATYDVIVAMERDIRDNNQNPGGSGWELEYAKQILDANSGNNYEKAALIAQMLKYFGYDAMAQPCIVDGESAGLVFVNSEDGSQLICSPALGDEGWMMDSRAISYQIDNGSSSSDSASGSGDSSEGTSSSSSDGETEYDVSSDETVEL